MSNQYYDLTTTGVAYVNRFRKVKPDQGDDYYSVTLAAMRGKANNEGHIQKTYIDCNVVGNAVEMVQQLESFFHDGAEHKVMIKFVLSDLELRSFVYKSGERKGQTGYALKGRLFDIKWYKVNGDTTVYSAAEIERHQQMNENSTAEENSTPTLPKVVKLVNDDPYYDERENQLIEQGYVYQGASRWQLPDAVV
jgi:hypothetical protein